MRELRRAELICGVLAGMIGVAVAILFWIIPGYSYGGNVYRNGQLISSVTHYVSLAQELGELRAITVLATIGVIALTVTVATVQHVHTRNAGWIVLLWVAAIFYALFAFNTVLLFYVLFWPGALLALAAAVLATIANVQARRVHSLG